ncbi:hypothetical protein LOK49_LG13G01002 [Camellia lanceoleosa]|uniref:Uncharacterized protein n=1 Tax=Camellia lanceoleosa TaxID=1840588 RepID=A0ACC0FMM3_9ERIC|nr:hypothetical protein LOK49_LG13G01002 [Camellia lanceoleosa]
MWTDEEDRELVYALFDMVNTGNHKADNDFKSGFLGVLEGVLHEKLPGCGIKAKPHIESRVKTLKRDTGTVFDMSHKRAAHWKNRSFPHCDMLCIIFKKDRAMGKDAVTTDDVLEEKRKNSSDRSDAFREAVMIIGTKIEEATDKFSRALGVDLDIALKRDKINEELCKLSNP